MTDDPINLREGSVNESAVDLELSGPVLSWKQSRTFRIQTPNFSTSLGHHWFDGMADMRIKVAGTEFDVPYAPFFGPCPSSGDDGGLFPQYELRFNARGIVPLVAGESSGDVTPYEVPSDWPITVIDETHSSKLHFVVREKYSDKIYIFHDFNTAKDENLRGRLAEFTTRQLYEASPRIPGYRFSYSSNGRLLQIIPPPPQDNLRIVYKYQGALTEKISSVQVWNGLEGSGTPLMRVDYLYWDDVSSPASDLGTTSCLVQVKVSKRSSNDTGSNLSIVRYTQYRYDPQPHEYTYLNDDEGVIRSIYDHAAILQMMEDSTTASQPEDLLQLQENDTTFPLYPYASKRFEYFAVDEDTSNIDTPWDEGENLITKYGGDKGGKYPTTHEIRVKAEHIGRGAGCTSCSGGSARAITRQYHYLHVWPRGVPNAPAFQWWIWHNHTAPYDINETRMLVVEDTLVHDDPTNFPAGRPLYRKIYALNDFSRKLREVLIEDPREESLRCWCWAWTFVNADANGDGRFISEVDSPHLKHRVAEYRLPSAHNVNTADGLRKFLDPYQTNGNGWDNDISILRSDGGLIYEYEYENAQGLRTGELVKTRANGQFTTPQYVSAIDWGDGSANRPKDRIVATYVYPAQSLARSSGTQTKYEYTFWDGSPNYRQLKSRIIKVPAVVTSQNGSASGSPDPSNATVVANEEYYDKAGRLRWTKDGEGYVTYYSYHPQTGKQAYIAMDVPNSYSPAVDNSKWVPVGGGSADTIQPSRGNNLPTALAHVTTHEFDAQGRSILTTGTNGAKHFTAYQQDATNKVGRTIQLRYWNSSTNQPRLPIEVQEIDDQGRLKATYLLSPTFSLSFNNGVPIGLGSAPSASNYVGLTLYGYDTLTDRLTNIDRYHTIPTTLPGNLTNFDRTAYVYDSEGHTSVIVQSAEGTALSSATVQVELHERDVLGRSTIHKKWRAAGINIDPTSQSTDLKFDSLQTIAASKPKFSETIYDNGNVGDSHVTNSRRYFDLGNDDYTETVFKRTFRGHVRGIEGTKGGTSFTPHAVLDVDWLGRTTASAHYTSINWSNVLTGDNYSNYATTTTGRNGWTKLHYDILGRVYRTERFPGTEGTKHFETNNYYDRSGRLVAMGQKHQAHQEFAYDGAGRLYQQRTVIQLATPDGTYGQYTSGGAFNYVAPAPKPAFTAMSGDDGGVIELTHTSFDVENATEVHTVETNHDDSNGFSLSSGVPAGGMRRTVYSWFDGADRLSTSADFGSGDTASGSGAWKSTTVPTRGTEPANSSNTKLVTKYGYDAATSRLEVVTSPAGMITKTFYDSLGRRRFAVENHQGTFNPTTTDPATYSYTAGENRTTGFTYNGLSKTTKLTAYNNSSSTGHQVTDYAYLDNFDASLVTHIIYPDATNRTPETTFSASADQVRVEYNVDASIKRRKDQRGVIIEYTYDDARRLAREGATTVPSGVDNTIRSIVHTYDLMGRPEKITSYSGMDGTGTIHNEIKYSRGGTEGLVTKTEQSHQSAVTSGTPSVQYAYDDAASSDVYTNGLRLKMVTYPKDTRKIHSTYGSSGVADVLDRVDMFEADNGSGSPGTDLVQYSYNGTARLVLVDFGVPDVRLDLYQGTSGTYAGYDRFGRTVDQKWYDYTSGTTLLDRQLYTYDYAGNRLTMANDHALVNWQDYKYEYDNLERYKSYKYGTLASGDVGSPAWQEVTTLDQLGNWTRLQWGSALDYLDQSRTHNAVNEIGTIGVNSGIGTNWADPVHDAAGNMTTIPRSSDPGDTYVLIYDAWNRLVKVESDEEDPISSYEYDGLGRRIRRLSVEPAEVRHYYYNKGWQLLEERKEVSGTEDPDPFAQYLWHPYYIDALAVRWYDSDLDGSGIAEHYYLHDANFNVTSVTNDSGTVQERYRYTPYGGTWFMDASFAPLSGNVTAIGNTHLYTGREADPDTKLQLNRHRFYSNLLGRWTTRDPIEYRGGSNLYAYAGDVPLKYIDPTGLIVPIFPPGQEPFPPGMGPPNSAPGLPWPPPDPGKPCCDGSNYDPLSQCCEDNQVVDKVRIWVCKGGLGGDSSLIAKLCSQINAGPPAWPFNKLETECSNTIGPVAHSYIVCDELDDIRSDQFGFHPYPFNDWQSLPWGPGYVNLEEERDPLDPGTKCEERMICPKQKESMCKAGPWSDNRYHMFGPNLGWSTKPCGYNCHGWVWQ